MAGPVTVAALALSVVSKNKVKKSGLKLKDSKKLSSKQRGKWFVFIKKEKIPYALASVSPKIIDRINISRAANLAASRALAKLLIVNNLASKSLMVLLDGGLRINPKSKIQKSKSQFKNQNFQSIRIKTIIKGDEKIPAISLASIVAKVNRDRLMKKRHKKYCQYDFINNVGYGTKKHFAAIRKFGLTPMHRCSFLKKYAFR